MNEQMNIEAIWQQYQQSLTAFLHSRISDHDAVQDVLQEVLIKSHQNLSSLKDAQSLKSWLFQITQHAVIDYYRTNSRVEKLNALFEQEQTGEMLSDTLPSDVKIALGHCVLPFIDALPSESAQLLRDIELSSVSQKVYAETQGIAYSTLKSRVQKARKELRGLFEQCCQFTFDARGNISGYQRKHDCSGC